MLWFLVRRFLGFRWFNLGDISLNRRDDPGIFVINQVTFVTRSTTHLLFGLCWRIHSRKSMLFTSSYKRSKSSWLETRKGCSKTRLLLADGWWYWRAADSVLFRIKPKAKLTLNTVGWSAKMLFSCSRRLAGLMMDKRKLYQSCRRLCWLKRVRICNQCCHYFLVIFPSLLGTRLAGIKTGSDCQLELVTISSAPVMEAGSEAVRVLAWSDLLDLFAAGASLDVVAVRFLIAAVVVGFWCALQIWALKGARLWNVSPHVLQVDVRSAVRLSWAFRWQLKTNLSENRLSQRRHS